MSTVRSCARITDIPAKRPSILLVEGDRRLGLFLAAMLGKQGYDVTLAHGSDDSSLSDAAPRVDLIILDHRPPAVDGIAALRKMRQWDDAPPVLVINGWSDEMAPCICGTDSLGEKIPAPRERFLSLVSSLLESRSGGSRVEDPEEEFWADLYAENLDRRLLRANEKQGEAEWMVF